MPILFTVIKIYTSSCRIYRYYVALYEQMSVFWVEHSIWKPTVIFVKAGDIAHEWYPSLIRYTWAQTFSSDHGQNLDKRIYVSIFRNTKWKHLNPRAVGLTTRQYACTTVIPNNIPIIYITPGQRTTVRCPAIVSGISKCFVIWEHGRICIGMCLWCLCIPALTVEILGGYADLEIIASDLRQLQARDGWRKRRNEAKLSVC